MAKVDMGTLYRAYYETRSFVENLGLEEAIMKALLNYVAYYCNPHDHADRSKYKHLYNEQVKEMTGPQRIKVQMYQQLIPSIHQQSYQKAVANPPPQPVLLNCAYSFSPRNIPTTARTLSLLEIYQ